MRTKNFQGRRAAVAFAVGSLLIMSNAGAANPESVTAEVEFVDPITITEVNALQFGLLDQNLADLETVVIGTNSAVTDAAGRVQGGTQSAANLTVGATDAQAITILVDNVSNGTGYALSAFKCDYNTAASSGACDGSGLSATSGATATLLIGATLTGDGLAAIGAANGSFDVTVTYQ
ncbi:MAG: DUF4402 domain-containing protein [Woeseia sp.]